MSRTLKFVIELFGGAAATWAVSLVAGGVAGLTHHQQLVAAACLFVAWLLWLVRGAVVRANVDRQVRDLDRLSSAARDLHDRGRRMVELQRGASASRDELRRACEEASAWTADVARGVRSPEGPGRLISSPASDIEWSEFHKVVRARLGELDRFLQDVEQSRAVILKRPPVD